MLITSKEEEEEDDDDDDELWCWRVEPRASHMLGEHFVLFHA